MEKVNIQDELEKVINDTVREVGLSEFTKVLPRRIIDRLGELSTQVNQGEREQVKEVERVEEHVVLPRKVQTFVARQEKRLSKESKQN